jgi:hypothetical protein
MAMEPRRWPIALAVIAAVVTAAAVMICLYSDAPGQMAVRAVGDGSGGAIIAWQSENGLYVQRVDAAGQPLWGKGGRMVAKVRATVDIYAPSTTHFTLTADGTGGAIVTWYDRSHLPGDRDDPGYYDPVPVYSQRISSGGEFLWGDGVTTGKTKRIAGSFPQVVPDGSGGAIFAWDDYEVYYRGLVDDYLRLQRLAPDGTPLWGEAGVLVVASSPFRPITDEEIAAGIKGTSTRSRPTYEGRHDVISDGAAGVIVFWEEEEADNSDSLYAQRIDGEGRQVWPERVPVASGQVCSLLSVISDGAGGAILAITGQAPAATCLRRLDGGGEVGWLEGGVLIPSEYPFDMIGDGRGGVVLYWNEANRPSGPPEEARYSLVVQMLNQSGEVVWPEKTVFTTDKAQYYTASAADDAGGGAVLAWRLYGQESFAYGEVLAQRLDVNGIPLWPGDGVVVFTDPDLKYTGTPEIVGDGSGGAIIITAAGKGVMCGDMVYAQRLDAAGNPVWGAGIRIDR